MHFNFMPDAYYRGLLIDKARGNILKVDRHKLVDRAYHGCHRELTAEQRRDTYSFRPSKSTFSKLDKYISIDTMFLLIGESVIYFSAAIRPNLCLCWDFLLLF